MKVSEFNQTMSYLLRPQPRQNLAIGGGVVEGEDLGSREGFANVKGGVSEQFRNFFGRPKTTAQVSTLNRHSKS